MIHGRYSKALPARLLSAYHDTLEDARNGLSSRDNIGVVNARLAELFNKLDTGESGEVWRSIRETWGAMQAAMKAQDATSLAAATHRLGQLIERGTTDYNTWREIYTAMHTHRKLVETQYKTEQIITASQAQVLLGAVVSVLKTHIHDTNVLAAIGRDIGSLVGSPLVHPPSD